MKKFKKLLSTIAMALALVIPAAPALVPATASAQAGTGTSGSCLSNTTQAQIGACLNNGTCLDTTGANCGNAGSPDSTVNKTIALVINIFSLVVGVVAVIMIIIGGFKYITSGGESSNISGAKNTILYAIVGLVVVAVAQIIVRFVLTKVA